MVKNRLILLYFLFISFNALSVKFSNLYEESFVVKKGYQVILNNQHGNISIIPVKSDTLSIEINVEADFEVLSDSADFFGSIDIKLSRSGEKIYARTVLSTKFDYHIPYSINYIIYTPDSLMWDITNKFGDLKCDRPLFISSLNFEYGDLRVPALRTLNRDVANFNFVQCDIYTDTLEASLVRSESATLHIGTATDLILRSEFSHLNFKELTNSELHSYTDNIQIEEGSELKINSSYSNLELSSPGGNIYTDMSFGKLNIKNISNQSSTLNISLNKVQSALEINDQTNLLFNAEMKYCDLKNAAVINKLQRINDGFIKTYKGSMGDATKDPAILTIVSKFEDVEIRIKN